LTTVTASPPASTIAVLINMSPSFAPAASSEVQGTTTSVLSTSTVFSIVVDLTTLLVSP
jgi:hypothetical protein